MTKDDQAALHRGDRTDIGIVRYYLVNMGKPGGGGVSSHQANLLCLTGTKDHKNDAAYMKEVDFLFLEKTLPLEDMVVNEYFGFSWDSSRKICFLIL